MMPRLLVTSLLVLGLAACGSTSDTSSQTSTPPSSDLGSVQKDDKLAALLPPEIASAGTLKVGSNIQNPPNNFYDQDGKTPLGSEVDLIKAISAKLGLKAEHSDMAFSSLITSLETGRVDVTMAAMNDTAERQQKIDFVDYFTSGITIMVQKGNPQGVKAVDDLCGKGIAVNLGSSQEQFAKDQSQKCVAAGKPEVQLSVTDSDTGNQNQLRTGRVAAILNDLPTAVYVSKTAGEGQYFEVVPLAPINGGPYGIGVAKKNAKLSEAIKAALQSLIDDGTYEKILTTWDIKQGAITKATINGK
ncbi:ABC transporter substrate-binding protein [Lentzea sp. E54]|uniref:ABC transporter substrate-binding protein n=1 Tax=Lentzea xerophila TaxID=3435883 RepID=UPI003DA52BAD